MFNSIGLFLWVKPYPLGEMIRCIICSVNMLFLWSSPIKHIFPNIHLLEFGHFSTLSFGSICGSLSCSVLSAFSFAISRCSNTFWHLSNRIHLKVILSLSSTNSGKRQQVQYNVAYISRNVGPVNTLSQIWDLPSVRVSAQLMSMPFTWINGLRHCWFRTLHCVVQDLLQDPLLLRISLMLLHKWVC